MAGLVLTQSLKRRTLYLFYNSLVVIFKHLAEEPLYSLVTPTTLPEAPESVVRKFRTLLTSSKTTVVVNSNLSKVNRF